MNPPGMKSPGRNIDIFFAGDLVMLIHFPIAYLSLEIPTRVVSQRRRNQRLRRVESGQRTCCIHSRRGNDAVVVHREEIDVLECVVAINFYLQ